MVCAADRLEPERTPMAMARACGPSLLWSGVPARAGAARSMSERARLARIIDRVSWNRSAAAAREDPEEALDVGVGGDIAVAVEVRIRRARRAAAPGEAGEEGLDIPVAAPDPVVVEVDPAAEIDR